MTNQGNTTNRPLLWDDDPPAELRPRRTREVDGRVRPATAGRRNSPGMPSSSTTRKATACCTRPRSGLARPRQRQNALVASGQQGGPRVSCACRAPGAGRLHHGQPYADAFSRRDARFRIAGSGNIQATGLTEVSRAELLPVFGEDIGRNIFFVPLNERRRALESIPWIEHATVMRVLPDQIRVAIVERQPVAFTRHGQQIGLVDANGVLLTMSAATMAERHYSFPVVTGIDPGDSAESRKARMAVYLRLMAELDAGGKHNSEQISEIDLTDPEDARVLMPEQGADILAHFGEDHFLERYQRYKAHIAEWRQQYPHLASVDLRYDNQVVLEMASAQETSDASAGGDAAANASNTATGRRRALSQVRMRASKRSGQADGNERTSRARKRKHAAPKRTTMNTGANASQRSPAATAGRSRGRRRGRVSAMSQKQDNLIVVLDIGSAWTRVLVADVNEGVLRYRGHGVVESAGMRKGLIAELAPAAKAVRRASEQAERAARVNIDECMVGVGGPHIRGLNTNGGIQLGRGMREITREDVRAAVDHARAIERPADREILHLLPRQFILDEQPGIFDPVGMVGARLEVELHIATCSGSALQSTVTCANRAGLEVSEAVLEADRRGGVHALGRRARTRRLPARHRRALERHGGVFRGRGGVHRVGSHRRRALHQRPRHRPADAGGAGRGTQAAIWQCGRHRGAATGGDRNCQSSAATPGFAHCSGDSGAARARADVLRERKPAPGRRLRRIGRRMRAHRRRRHAARNAGRDREPVARAGAHGFAHASAAHARGTEPSVMGREYRHDSLRASHASHARGRRQPEPEREVARHVCREFLRKAGSSQ